MSSLCVTLPSDTWQSFLIGGIFLPEGASENLLMPWYLEKEYSINLLVLYYRLQVFKKRLKIL